jgi:4-diphosphocytidyl-2-C-methyl-D-erythritol kinase
MLIRIAHVRGGALEARIPAKVNVSLAVLGRRPDGYHEIDTIMLPIGIEDRLTVGPSATRRLALALRGGAGVPGGRSNTVMRAALSLRETAGIDAGARLTLDKRIPVGAGLGGGSADAAGALSVLDRFWRCRVNPRLLHALAAGVGSDVPFFLGAGAARARGRGERITPVVCPRPFHLVLVYPGFAVSTRRVYETFSRLPSPACPRRMAGMLRALRDSDPDAMAAHLRNDLEPAALQVAPRLRALRSRLEQFPFLGVGMSGSGSTFFGICRDAASARRLAREVRAKRLGRVWAITAGGRV